jgi:hypothetical protein
MELPVPDKRLCSIRIYADNNGGAPSSIVATRARQITGTEIKRPQAKAPKSAVTATLRVSSAIAGQ